MSQRPSDVYLQNNVKPLTSKQRLEEEERRRYAEMLQISEKLKRQAQAIQNQQKQGSTTKEPIYYILVTAGVLIAGYFAYKKFIK